MGHARGLTTLQTRGPSTALIERSHCGSNFFEFFSPRAHGLVRAAVAVGLRDLDRVGFGRRRGRSFGARRSVDRPGGLQRGHRLPNDRNRRKGLRGATVLPRLVVARHRFKGRHGGGGSLRGSTAREHHGIGDGVGLRSRERPGRALHHNAHTARCKRRANERGGRPLRARSGPRQRYTLKKALVYRAGAGASSRSAETGRRRLAPG